MGLYPTDMDVVNTQVRDRFDPRQREIDQGWVLICCSKPTSDLVIER